MTDLHEIAALFAKPDGRLRLRQGEVSAIADDGSVSVKLGGSSTAVSGVKLLASVCPMVGGGLWLAGDGMDLIGIGTVTPTGPAFVDVRRSSAQSIPTATDRDIDFLSGATVDADTHGMFDTAASDRVTIKVPGVYGFTYGTAWASNGTGTRSVWIEVDAVAKGRIVVPGFSGGTNVIATCTEVECALKDVVQLFVRQSSGGSLDCQAFSHSPRLTARWLRPLTPT